MVNKIHLHRSLQHLFGTAKVPLGWLFIHLYKHAFIHQWATVAIQANHIKSNFKISVWPKDTLSLGELLPGFVLPTI